MELPKNKNFYLIPLDCAGLYVSLNLSYVLLELTVK